MQHNLPHRRQMSLHVGKWMKLINLDFYLKLIKKRICFNNSMTQHHYEIFTSASANPHASLPNAPSSDEVTSWEMDDFFKPRLLLETDKKGYPSTTQWLSTIMKQLPQYPRSRMHHYQTHRRQTRLQVGKWWNLINLDFYLKLIKNNMPQQLDDSSPLWNIYLSIRVPACIIT